MDNFLRAYLVYELLQSKRGDHVQGSVIRKDKSSVLLRTPVSESFVPKYLVLGKMKMETQP